MMRSESLIDKVKGVIYGSALGDAWGYITEFKGFDEIYKNQISIPKELVISDDTQMSIYNIQAVSYMLNIYSEEQLNNIAHDISLQNEIRKIFAEYHLKWLRDPRNNRAPGATCLNALEKYSKISIRLQGNEGSWGNNRKGCGTIMRAPWLGLLPLNRESIAILSILQSETTHAHPTASISSAVSSLLVNDLFYEKYNLLGNDEAFRVAFKILDEIRSIEIPLVQNSMMGIEEVEKSLIHSVDNWESFSRSKDTQDINHFFGEGWIAEEALMNALAAVSFYSPSFVSNSINGIKRLVYSNGDSDSIAAIGGSFLGAYNGYNSFDYPISEHIEECYKSELDNVVNVILKWLHQNIELY